MDFSTPTLALLSNKLGDSDASVRNLCLDVLHKHPQRSIKHSKEVLAQLALHGPDFYNYEHQAVKLPLDEEGIQQLTTLCRSWLADGYVEESARYLRWLLNVDRTLLPTAKEALSDLDIMDLDPGFNFLMPKCLHKDLDVALEATKLSDDEILNELDQLTTEMVHYDEFPDEQWDCCKLLIKNLSQAGDAIETSKAKTREWLGLSYTANEEGPNDWKILVAVTMAGQLKMDDTALQLIELLKVDWDPMNEDIQEAFICMNSKVALDTISDQWAELPEHGRLYLASAFRVLLPEGFEAFYNRVLDDETEDSFTANTIAHALIHTGQQQALDHAQGYVNRFDPDDVEALQVSEALYIHYILRDYQTQLVVGIKRRISQRYQRIEERRVELESGFGQPKPPKESINNAPKVGRNAPCPCGSGKKHKKCCL